VEQQGPGPDECLRCRRALTSMGVERIRVGGSGGGWKLLLGEWAELGEGFLPLEVFVCENCRNVEFRAPRDGD
jgi:hypothetical protein